MTATNRDASLPLGNENNTMAAELVLGLLEGAEAQAAVEKLSSDPEFAQTVRDWQEILAGIGENMTPVMAPARAWQNIRERLGHSNAVLTEDPTDPLPWWRGPKGWLAGLITIAAIVALIWMAGTTNPAG